MQHFATTFEYISYYTGNVNFIVYYTDNMIIFMLMLPLAVEYILGRFYNFIIIVIERKANVKL